MAMYLDRSELVEAAFGILIGHAKNTPRLPGDTREQWVKRLPISLQMTRTGSLESSRGAVSPLASKVTVSKTFLEDRLSGLC